jgi:hypothetical protein
MNTASTITASPGTAATRTLAQLWEADARPGDGTRPEKHETAPAPADDAG